MKTTKYLLILAGLAGLYTILQARPRQVDVQSYRDREAKSKKKINDLLHAGLYDSAIAYCADARKSSQLGYDELERALATIYWHKGEKEKAYQYLLNQADYHLRLNGGGGTPFDMLYDFSFGPAIPTDTFLEDMVLNKISDYYRSLHYFPERNTGLKLLLFHYREQKMIRRNRYRLQQCADEACKDLATKDLLEQRAVLYREVTAWLKQQGKLYTESEAGPAASFQYSFIRNMPEPEDHALFTPIMYEAMKRKEIKPDIYVDELLAQATLQGADSLRTVVLQDSLCKIYECYTWRANVKRYVVYSQGDSVTSYIDVSGLNRGPLQAGDHFSIAVEDSTGKTRLILADSIVAVPSGGK